MNIIWNIPKPNVQPVSRASRSTISSRRLSRMSAARRKIACRAPGAVAAHSGNAAAAAAIARPASARVPAGTFATVSPVKGSRTSKVAPPSDASQSPPMKWRASRGAEVVVDELMRCSSPVAIASSERRCRPRPLAIDATLGAVYLSRQRSDTSNMSTRDLSGYSQSLERGLAILSSFSPQRPLLGISELARAVALSRSTAHRYVATLAALRYLEQDAVTRKYRLGPRVLDLGFSAINSMELREIAAPHLQQLSDTTGHTVNLGVLDGVDIVYIERCRSSQIGQREIDLNLHVGSRLPAYCTSLGKVLLAFLPEEQRRGLLERVEFVRRGSEHGHRQDRASLRAQGDPGSRRRREQRGARLRPALDRRAGAVAGGRGGRCDQPRRPPVDDVHRGSGRPAEPCSRAHRVRGLGPAGAPSRPDLKAARRGRCRALLTFVEGVPIARR